MLEREGKPFASEIRPDVSMKHLVLDLRHVQETSTAGSLSGVIHVRSRRSSQTPPRSGC